MNVIQTEIKEVLIIEPQVYTDQRGYFFEAFSNKEFAEKVSGVTFVQDSESKSKYGTIRGLHFQKPPYTQSKLVRVVQGKVLDVVVDIRKGSPTFGRHIAVELSAQNKRQVFIPRGFAHGFAVLSKEAIFQYKCDNYYAPNEQGSILWNDASLAIDWKIPLQEVILSERDQKSPLLKDAYLFDYQTDLYK